MSQLTHINESGETQMVSVDQKSITHRQASASAKVIFPADVFEQITRKEGNLAKGNILEVARIAGIMAAKKTHELIPLCHPLMLEKCKLKLNFSDTDPEILIKSTVALHHKTGVEMEALTAVSVAALTIYDMCKALSHAIQISAIELTEKTGGKRDVSK